MEQQLRLQFWTLPEELQQRSYYGAQQFLEEEGYTYLGSGACARAYLTPDGDKVIKVCGGDPGARATVDAALANPDNPHLPRTYWMVDLEDGGFAVECERLEPCSDRKFREWTSKHDPGRRERVSATTITGRSKMSAALRALQKAAAEYQGDGLIWDTHGQNLMLRKSDGRIVLNDCLYSAGESVYDYYRESYSNSDCDCAAACPGQIDAWCDECRLKVAPPLPLTLLFHGAPARPSWLLRDEIKRLRVIRLHAEHRHCGDEWCVECEEQPLPLAA